MKRRNMMHQGPTTLQGVFPETKPAYRRNFIKENMQRIKLMQEVSQSQHSNVSDTKLFRRDKINKSNILVTQTTSKGSNNVEKCDKANDPPEVKKAQTNLPLAEHFDNNVNNINAMNRRGRPSPRGATTRAPLQKVDIKKKADEIKPIIDDRILHRGVQTEPLDAKIEQIFATGVIKYPSPGILSSPKLNKGVKLRSSVSASTKDQGHGDSYGNENSSPERQEKDFLKENMLVKPKTTKRETHDPLKPPPNYKRGVVPKYIKQKKDVAPNDEGDVECPPGHVLLPDEERKETLKVLRESYADKIQELNSMPVRSDTLRMQKRKMELEEDLKKIDEGIKVFQRPKVFVKINV